MSGVKIRFELAMKNRAQVALLLWTIDAAGGRLADVTVVGKDGTELTGEEALAAWREHAAKRV